MPQSKSKLINIAAVMAVAELSKLIGSIGKRKVALDQAVQTAAIQCIAQSIVHRNSTPAANLYDVLEGSMRRDSLIAYFEDFGNLMWSKIEKRVVFADLAKLPTPIVLEWTDEYATKVASKLWYTAKPEPTPKSVYDFMEEASRFLDRLKSLSKKATEVKHKDLADELTMAYNRYVFKKANTTMSPAELLAAGHETEADQAGVAVEKVEALAAHFGKPQVKAA